MFGALLPSLNKEWVGYPSAPVCRSGGSWGGQEFAGRDQAGEGCGGSIGAVTAAAPGARIGQADTIRAHMENQALSAGLAGQVARLKLHGMAKALELLGFVVPGWLMASYQTVRLVIVIVASWARPVDRPRGGWSPLSDPSPLPYPGRAGQTSLRQKPAQARPCAFGCDDPALAGGAEIFERRVGSGVGAATSRAIGLARTKLARVRRGPGIGLAGAVHIRLNRGKGAKLGGGRS